MNGFTWVYDQAIYIYLHRLFKIARSVKTYYRKVQIGKGQEKQVRDRHIKGIGHGSFVQTKPCMRFWHTYVYLHRLFKISKSVETYYRKIQIGKGQGKQARDRHIKGIDRGSFVQTKPGMRVQKVRETLRGEERQNRSSKWFYSEQNRKTEQRTQERKKREKKGKLDWQWRIDQKKTMEKTQRLKSWW